MEQVQITMSSSWHKSPNVNPKFLDSVTFYLLEAPIFYNKYKVWQF